MEVETMTCSAEQCSRPEGHPMPHGQEVQPGLVIAPWSDSARKRSDNSNDSPIACNSCGAELILDPERSRAKCSSCDQRIAFDERGYTQTILPSLYPSNITDPVMMRKMGMHSVQQWEFFDTLELRFGLIDEEEFARRRTKAGEKLAQFIIDDVEPLEINKVEPLEKKENRSWWKIWKMFS